MYVGLDLPEMTQKVKRSFEFAYPIQLFHITVTSDISLMQNFRATEVFIPIRL